MERCQFKHRFKVNENGIFVWDDPEMFKYAKRSLIGKRGYAIIEEEEGDISVNQYSYYFGIVIRRYCMASDVFAGWTMKQIHTHLFSELRSELKRITLPSGVVKTIVVPEDFDSYKQNDMAKYLEQLVPHLAVDYNIHVRPIEDFNYKKNK